MRPVTLADPARGPAKSSVTVPGCHDGRIVTSSDANRATPAASASLSAGTTTRRRTLTVVEPGSTTGIGSLPHRNAKHAAEFSLDAYDIPAIPTLPRRSPAEA